MPQDSHTEKNFFTHSCRQRNSIRLSQYSQTAGGLCFSIQKNLSLVQRSTGIFKFTQYLFANGRRRSKTDAASALQEKLADKLYLFLAPSIIGGDGKSWCGNLNLKTLQQQPKLKIKKTENCADDILVEAQFIF